MNNTTITTREVRLSYVHLLEPYSYLADGVAKYQVTILVKKLDVKTYEAINNAIENAKLEGKAKWNNTIPPKLKLAMYDGDGTREDGTPFGDECKGHYVLSAKANANRPPVIVDMNKNEILDPAEIYSGMYAKVNINFYPYNYNGNKGIGISINGVQKTRDGERLGGGAPSVDEMF